MVIGSLDGRLVFSASWSKEVFVVKMLVLTRSGFMDEASVGPTKHSTEDGCGIISVNLIFDL